MQRHRPDQVGEDDRDDLACLDGGGGAGSELCAAPVAEARAGWVLDAEIAALYGVRTKALVQAAKRNPGRFPADFIFRLTPDEASCLRSQSVTSNARGGRRYLPYAFTEQGVAMLSSVLRSPRAIAVNIEIIRVFVKLREVMASHAQLARKLDELESAGSFDTRISVKHVKGIRTLRVTATDANGATAVAEQQFRAR